MNYDIWAAQKSNGNYDHSDNNKLWSSSFTNPHFADAQTRNTKEVGQFLKQRLKD